MFNTTPSCFCSKYEKIENNGFAILVRNISLMTNVQTDDRLQPPMMTAAYIYFLLHSPATQYRKRLVFMFNLFSSPSSMLCRLQLMTKSKFQARTPLLPRQRNTKNIVDNLMTKPYENVGLTALVSSASRFFSRHYSAFFTLFCGAFDRGHQFYIRVAESENLEGERLVRRVRENVRNQNLLTQRSWIPRMLEVQEPCLKKS